MPRPAAKLPAIKSLDTQPNNLSAQLTSFIGREKEIAEIKAVLNSARLVTLTGSGGTGKTRLSIEVGLQLLPIFSNGVWMIELAPLSDPAQIIPRWRTRLVCRNCRSTRWRISSPIICAIKNSCSFSIIASISSPPAQNSRMISCVDARGTQNPCQRSRKHWVSRAKLLIGLPRLRIPDQPPFRGTRPRPPTPKFSSPIETPPPSPRSATVSMAFLWLLELAAARITGLLAPEQIATRLDDLFRLLVGGSRTALPRQTDPAGVDRLSYVTYSPEQEKNLLRIASVFVGGWILEALEAVSEDPRSWNISKGLVNKSLVVTEEH
ncbi:MAG: hypothetical protein IPJ46_06865 [Anaerolineales bacterium]|nr:hypothetical protein [Anaerolineales bacterium]